jgi:hypothetical protein
MSQTEPERASPMLWSMSRKGMSHSKPTSGKIAVAYNVI